MYFYKKLTKTLSRDVVWNERCRCSHGQSLHVVTRKETHIENYGQCTSYHLVVNSINHFNGPHHWWGHSIHESSSQQNVIKRSDSSERSYCLDCSKIIFRRMFCYLILISNHFAVFYMPHKTQCSGVAVTHCCRYIVKMFHSHDLVISHHRKQGLVYSGLMNDRFITCIWVTFAAYGYLIIQKLFQLNGNFITMIDSSSVCITQWSWFICRV